MDISEIHNRAIDEYIDSILLSDQLIFPFIDKAMEIRIRKLVKGIFLAGYDDAVNTNELIKSEDTNTQIGTIMSFGMTDNY